VATELFVNDLSITLGAAVNTAPAAGTVETWTVSSSAGFGFGAAGQYRGRVDSEIVLITAAPSGTTLTVTRGQEGTTPATHANGATLSAVLTAGALNNAIANVVVGPTFINVKTAYGATGNGTTNDTAAINAMCADTAAGIRQFPPGLYMTDGGHALPPYVHIQGAEPATRFWGYNTAASPPTACALKMRAGSTQTAMFKPGANYTAASVRDLTLLGANVGTNVHGFQFAVPSTEHNTFYSNVAIIGFTGSGITGRLFAQRWAYCFLGGNLGYGLNCTGTDLWTDVRFSNFYVTGNVLGGANFDSSGANGYVLFDRVRLERSGWNPGNIIAPVATSSPGLRIRGNLERSTFDIETDANSGHGVDIQRSAGRSIHHLNITGNLTRDGFGTMAGSTPPGFAAIKILGDTSALSVDYIDLSGLVTIAGHAEDGGAQRPTYLHPQYGVWLENAFFLSYHGGSIGTNHLTPLYGGPGGLAAGTWRTQMNVRVGNAGMFVPPAWTTSTRPVAPLVGTTGWNTDVSKMETWGGSPASWVVVGP
jgi:hypothetical protein